MTDEQFVSLPVSEFEALMKERDRLREELRIRESSQMPVIPHGAQEQIDRLEAELGQAKETIAICAADTTAADLAQDIAFLEAEAADINHRGETWKAKAIAAEARLAKVPALVEATRGFAQRVLDCDTYGCENGPDKCLHADAAKHLAAIDEWDRE